MQKFRLILSGLLVVSAAAQADYQCSVSPKDDVVIHPHQVQVVGRVNKVGENGYIAIALNDTTEVVIKRDFVAAVLPKGTMKAL